MIIKNRINKVHGPLGKTPRVHEVHMVSLKPEDAEYLVSKGVEDSEVLDLLDYMKSYSPAHGGFGANSNEVPPNKALEALVERDGYSNVDHITWSRLEKSEEGLFSVPAPEGKVSEYMSTGKETRFFQVGVAHMRLFGRMLCSVQYYHSLR